MQSSAATADNSREVVFVLPHKGLLLMTQVQNR